VEKNKGNKAAPTAGSVAKKNKKAPAHVADSSNDEATVAKAPAAKSSTRLLRFPTFWTRRTLLLL